MNFFTATMRSVTLMLIAMAAFTLGACNDDDESGPSLNGNNVVYLLDEVGNSGISGTVTFAELSDGTTTVVVDLNGTSSGGSHPSHIHMNTAAEGGGIAISLDPIDGASGSSTTIIRSTDNGTAITYNELITYDGYVNVHESESNLGTLLAQGDIGQNALTGESVTYNLDERSESGVSGTATFYERLNNETLVVLDLAGTPAEGLHPSHIHMNTAAEGGSIAISLNEVDGATGISKTNVTSTDEAVGGDAVEYTDLTGYDGYINVHLSADQLGVVVAQGDIGQNALTGESVSYALDERSDSGVSGTVTFYERMNAETLVEIILDGTPADGDHPSHIHLNTAAEGGSIAISLTNVNGATGISRTNVNALNGGDPVTYADLLDFDGYVNVHLSAASLGIIVAQGDIGQNGLTGESVTYAMAGSATGTATFYERNNGETLVVLELTGYLFTGDHPSHIHMGSVASPGGIVISLTSVDANGISRTSVSMLDEDAGGTAITYAELLAYEGYINVHLSGANLGTLISQGNIGASAS